MAEEVWVGPGGARRVVLMEDLDDDCARRWRRGTLGDTCSACGRKYAPDEVGVLVPACDCTRRWRTVSPARRGEI